MPKKMHPADAADRAKIATATHFNVHLRRSPTSKINREAANLIEAIKIADEIKAEFSREAMIYAITPEGFTIFVPKDVVEAARAGEAAPAPVAAEEFADIPPSFRIARASRRAAIELIKASDGAAPAKDRDYPAPAAKPAKASRPEGGKRAAILEAAQRGELPAAPDFSAETHKRFRPKLAQLVELAEAGDIEGLKAIEIKPISSSPKAMAKYRDLAVIALEARAASKDAA